MTTKSEPTGLPDRMSLLTLAALAYNRGVDDGAPDYGFGKVYHPEGYWWRYANNDCHWNPLGNHPADIATRHVLAMAVKLSIDNQDCCVWRRLPSGELVQVWWGGDTGIDEPEAIVWAAYQVGKLQCLS